MSILSRLLEYFTPKIIFVGKSELSHPRDCKRSNLEMNLSRIRVLEELSRQQGKEITSHDFHKLSAVHSADKRLNDLYHMGYADARRVKLEEGTRLMYKINQFGEEYLLSR